jgi:hypothetical protein
MATQLEIIGDKERASITGRNSYNETVEYSSNSLNALSNGDEKGKGELNGSIGSLTDILAKNDLLGKNTYNENFQYNSSNPNALSDGDEKGKGELNNSIGSMTDIITKNESLGRNKYNDNKTYPDF